MAHPPGLCVVRGWVEREEVRAAPLCPGNWLQGDDLWMLHAWVVPDVRNRWGRFAQTKVRSILNELNRVLSDGGGGP